MATSDSLSGGLLLFSDEMNSLALAFFPVRPQLASEGAARRMATFPHLFAELSDRVWGGGKTPGGGGNGDLHPTPRSRKCLQVQPCVIKVADSSTTSPLIPNSPSRLLV